MSTSMTNRVVQWAVENPAKAFYGVTALWWLGGVLSVVSPLTKWKRNRAAYYSMYGKYIEYEQSQRNYERAQEQQNEQGNYMYDQYGNYDQNGQYDQDGNMNPNSYYRNCAWWNFGCRKQQNQWRQYQQQMNNNNNNGGGGNNEDRNIVYTPGWYQFLGGKQQGDSRDREEQGMTAGNSNGGAKFVYTWSLILFSALLIYGSAVMYSHYKYRKSMMQLMPHYLTILVLLICMLHYSLLQLVLVPQGVISTEDRELEESPYGFFGQWGILLVYWEFSQCLFSGIAALLLGVSLFMVRRYNANDANKEKVGGDEATADYNRVI